MPADNKAALQRARASATKTDKPFNTAATTSADKGRVTVDLGPDLYRRFKAGAAWHSRQMNDVIRELVDGWVDDHPFT